MPSQRVDEALLDLALQARVSLGGDVAACRGVSPALAGRMSLDTALTRLLAGSGCGYSIRPGGAVVIRRVPPPSPIPAARPERPAPEPALDEPFPLSEVVVTAGRRPETVQRAAASMTAVTGEQMVLDGAGELNDLEGLVAGMTVTNLGPGRNKIFLRGLSDGAFTGLTQSTVGLYLDLVPITYNAPDPDLKLVDIDRVEALRGPQGTLYGTGPISGVVRIVTRRPDPNQARLELATTQSRTYGGGLNSDYSATANLPLFDGRAAVRATLYDEAFSGYINDVSLKLRRVNDGSREGGRLTLGGAVAPGWNVLAGVVHQSIDTQDTHYVYRGLGPLRRANLVREPHSNVFDQTFLTVEGHGSWGRLEASAALVEHQFESRYDASSALPRFYSNGRIGALDEGKSIRLLVGEATFASPDAGRFRWLGGLLFSTNTTWSDATLSAIAPVRAEVYAEDRKDDLTEFAVYGEASFDLTPDMTLTAGGRYYTFDYSTSSDVVHGMGRRLFEGNGGTSGFTPKLALTYRLNDQVNLSAQISHGRRAGGFNTAGVIDQVFDARDTPAREYAPDSLWNFEVGAKAWLWDDRARIRAALFMSRWKDVQSDQFLPSGLAYVVNVGDGADVGVEIETSWRASEDLVIRANAMLADPEITDPNPAFNSRKDAGLPGVPSASVNLGAVYRRPLPGDRSVFVDADLAYVGRSRLTFDAGKAHSMGNYVTGRLSAGLETGRWTVKAFVDNLFDTEANTFAYSDPFRLPDAQAITPLRPRTIGVTLRWSY